MNCDNKNKKKDCQHYCGEFHKLFGNYTDACNNKHYSCKNYYKPGGIKEVSMPR